MKEDADEAGARQVGAEIEKNDQAHAPRRWPFHRMLGLLAFLALAAVLVVALWLRSPPPGVG